MQTNFLLVDSSKTKLVPFGTRQNLPALALAPIFLRSSLRSMGLILWSEEKTGTELDYYVVPSMIAWHILKSQCQQISKFANASSGGRFFHILPK